MFVEYFHAGVWRRERQGKSTSNAMRFKPRCRQLSMFEAIRWCMATSD
jgi:hypothetical protein